MRRAWHWLMAGSVAGVMTLAAGVTHAAILLDDFEAGLGGLSGTLTGSETADPPNAAPLAQVFAVSAFSAPVAPPAPSASSDPGAGMSVDMAGQGACDQLSGSSHALCGADTLKSAGPRGAVLSYDLNFSSISSILFDIAAFSTRDPFDHYRGLNYDIWGDFIRISSVIDGVETLLAEFSGAKTSDPDRATLAQMMVSTDEGAVLGAGVVAGQNFETVTLGLEGRFAGAGQLVFEIRTTGSAEQVGLDNIRFAPVPLPGTLLLAGLGLGYLGAARRRQPRRG